MATLHRRRFVFRPRLIPTVAAVVGVAVLLMFSSWQVQRHLWKQDIIAAVESRVHGVAVPLEQVTAAVPLSAHTPDAGPALTAAQDIWRKDHEFTRVRVDGVRVGEGTLRLSSKYYKTRKALGYHAVVPVVLANGQTVLVNRGWAPVTHDPDRLDTYDNFQHWPAGAPVTVEGIIRVPDAPRWFTPENSAETNHWFRQDIPAMAAALGVQGAVLPVMVDALESGTAGTEDTLLPIGISPDVRLFNDHFQYAVTWALLALTLALMYLFSAFKRVPEDA